MAGLDPRQHSSGSSVNKKPHLSKAGNSYLRIALYLPALSAAHHDPNVRAFYRHLIDSRGLKKLDSRSLKKLQAVCAVMRKLCSPSMPCLGTARPSTAAASIHLPIPLPDSSIL